MEPRLPLNVCARCLRASIVSRPGRKPAFLRATSTSALRAPAFTSFFFPNEQWTKSPLNGSSDPSALLPPTSLDGSYPPPLSAVPYRPTEFLTLRRTTRIYAQLSKAQLTGFNVLTAMAGFALCPLPTTVPVLLSTAIGTALCSASANTLNQLQEVPLDAQMARTRSRPLVRRAITPLHAASFALVAGAAGPAILWGMVNPTTALLGAANIALYAGTYTWLKRRSISNTWVGAVVGAIPPVMGWTAGGGQLLPSLAHPLAFFPPPFLSTLPVPDLALVDNALAPLALFLFLFSWQFPHFNGLSHVVRGAYAQAGYRMLSVLDPARNAAVSLRHTLALVPICSVLVPLSGLTTWAFALTSLPFNLFFARTAWRYWKTGSDKDARSTFMNSLWYLPVALGLMMVHKQGADWGKWIGWTKDEEEVSEVA